MFEIYLIILLFNFSIYVYIDYNKITLDNMSQDIIIYLTLIDDDIFSFAF